MTIEEKKAVIVMLQAEVNSVQVDGDGKSEGNKSEGNNGEPADSSTA